jgi:hypothetical protein
MYHSLPSEIINYIYEYDGTYTKHYDYVMLELVIRAKQTEYLHSIVRNHMRFLRTFYDFVNSEFEDVE